MAEAEEGVLGTLLSTLLKLVPTAGAFASIRILRMRWQPTKKGQIASSGSFAAHIVDSSKESKERNVVMPIYEFVCVECEASHDVLVDTTIKNEMELLCVHCGGVMIAAEVSRFSVISSSAGAGNRRVHPEGAKSCGHTHACRCAVKMTKRNPFQDRVDLALGNVKPE